MNIDPANWTTVNKLLDEALQRPESDRADWLQSLKPEYAEFEIILRRLLSRVSNAKTHDFLEQFPSIAAAFPPAPASDQRVGPYRLIRQLGEGGMASVWLAERADGLIERQVALKLPHGPWASAGLAERMARERQILAALDHRNIAKLFDAGLSANGQPYLALEYIEGLPIDEFCASTNNGEPRETKARLRLFLQVASAVAYAHGKLVLHRDLKPANILVDSDGSVRLLDFGVAKLLEGGETRESRLTELSGRALTPDYASPEQIVGEPLTVASDVYSLGVVLFELLTGESPYRLTRDSRGALEDAIVRAESVRPSDVARHESRRRIRGDLDTIVLKALKKEPNDRYATVNTFAEDVGRHLDDRPVLARPDNVSYRFKKFVVRNKLGVAAVTIVCFAVLAGTSAAVWQAREAMRQRDIAQQQQQRAENVKSLVVGIFRDADPDQNGGLRPSVNELLRQAAKKIEIATIDDPRVRAEMFRVLGSSLVSTKDFDAAKRVLDVAAEDAQSGFAPDDIDRLRLHVLRGDLLRYLGHVTAWRAELDQVEPYLDVLKKAAPEDYVTALKARAHWEIHTARYAAANHWATRAHDAAAELLGEGSQGYVRTLTMLATTYTHLREAAPALEFARRSHQGAMSLHQNNTKHPIVIDSRRVLALAYDISGQPERAITELETAVHDGAAIWGPSNATVGYYFQFLSNVQRRLGLLEESVASARESLAIANVNDVAVDSLEYLGREHCLAMALLASSRVDDAEPLLRTITNKASDLLGPTHPRFRLIASDHALSEAIRGDAHAALDRISKLDLLGGDNQSPEFVHALIIKGASERLAGDSAGAIRTLVNALEFDPTKFRDNDRAEAMLYLGLAQLEAGNHQEAEFRLREGLELLKTIGHRSSPLKDDAIAALARVRALLGSVPETANSLLLLRQKPMFRR